MRNPLRTAISVIVVVALIALRVWIRSDSTAGPDRLPPIQRNVNQARVITEDLPARPVTPFPAGNLHDANCRFSFGVYHDPLPLKPPAEVLQALAPRFSGLHQCAELEKGQALPAVMLKEMDTKEFVPPTEEDLRYSGRGLTPEQGKRLQKSGRVSVFFFLGEAAQASAVLKQGHEFVKAFAAETGGFLWDEETRECFTAGEWDKRGEAGWEGEIPLVSRHMVIHSYRNGSMLRAVTLGMWKFGLPDVCANDLTESEGVQVQSLINIACQTMIESGKIDSPGILPLDLKRIRCAKLREPMIASLLGKGTGKADLEVAIGTRDDGDADNRLIEIRFVRPSGRTETERRVAFFSAFFGSRDAVTQAEHDDELLAARDRARTKLFGPEKAGYQKGLPPGESLLVKAPFRTRSGGNEWMWVEVVEWKGKEITGVLMNDPFECPDLKSGARVAVTEDSLFDYIHAFADGHTDGNETGKILERRERESGGR